MNGYDETQLRIDDEMASLARPAPPVVSWTSGGLKDDFNARTAAWRAQLETWEQANPSAALRWSELRAQYEAHDELLLKRKLDPEQFNFELLRKLSGDERNVDAIRRPLDDRASTRVAREWMLDGTTWSLVLSGRPGCGKTCAVMWAAHQLLMRNFRPFWVNCARMVDAPMWGAEAELVKFRAREAGVLVLDDIGAGAREADAKPWLGWLDVVLAARHAARRKTLVTTNKSPEQLKAWLGLRLWDRISEGIVFGTNEPSMRGQSREPGSEG